jgi:dTDP-4-dehydrorhamnose reductase
MRILLTGAKGQVGTAIENELLEYDLTALSRTELDLTKLDHILSFLRSNKPSLIIHSAAYTQVDNAEIETEKSMIVNYHATKIIADYCVENAIPLIFFSSDYVFDGSKVGMYDEDDDKNPLNIYGESKLLAENYIVKNLNNYVILRTSWVYDDKGKNFFNTIQSKLISGEKLSVVSDQFGAPTTSYFIANVVKLILNKIKKNKFTWGIYHLTNKGVVSWLEFANMIALNLKSGNFGLTISSDEINPIRSEDYPTKARRPLNSVLDCKKIEEELGISIQTIEEGLRAVIKKKGYG